MTDDIRKLIESDVDFELECLPEDMEVRGNAVASGDDAYDKKIEDKILSDLEQNKWVWCMVKVTAKWKGFEGTDHLGGCQYDDEADFEQGRDFQIMKEHALDDLNIVLATTDQKLSSLKGDL